MPNMTKLSPAKVKAASNSSALLIKFVLAATLADSIARRSFPVGGAALTTCKFFDLVVLLCEDDRENFVFCTTVDRVVDAAAEEEEKAILYNIFLFSHSLVCTLSYNSFFQLKKSGTLNLALSRLNEEEVEEEEFAPRSCVCVCLFSEDFWKVPLDFFGGISDENFSQNRETIFYFPKTRTTRRGKTTETRHFLLLFFFLFSLLVLLSLDSHFRWK